MTARSATISKEAEEKKVAEVQEIPDYLIYEMIDGVPIYYRGYRDVLNNTKKLQDIMGYGGLQWYLLNLLGNFLTLIFKKNHTVLIGEGGAHLSTL